MFSFPWSNFHELNLDWILSVVKEAKEIFVKGEGDIQYAVETSEQALETAEQAAAAVIADGAVTIPKVNTDVYELYSYNVSGSVTTKAIPTGSLVVVRKSTIAGISDGVYVAATDIPQGAIITASDLATPSNLNAAGGLNYIQDIIKKLRPDQLKRKWIFVGDSYAHASGSNTGWIDRLVPLLGLTHNDYYETSQGGASMYGSPTFYSLIANLQIPADICPEITDILLVGGTNDIGVSEDNIKTGGDSFVTYCKTNFPNAVIHLGFTYGCNDTEKINIQYARALRGYSLISGVDFLQNLAYALHDNSLILQDGVHPTPDGYQILTASLYNAILGGCNVSYRNESVFTPPAGYQNAIGGAKCTATLVNDITTAYIDRCGKATTDASLYFPVTANTPIEIGSLNNRILQGYKTIGPYTTASGVGRLSVRSSITEQYYDLSCSWFVADGKLYATTRDPILTTTSAFTSCTAAIVSECACCIPSITI